MESIRPVAVDPKTGAVLEERIIGVELRLQTENRREELAMLACNVVVPSEQLQPWERLLVVTFHTSRGDIGATIDLNRRGVWA